MPRNRSILLLSALSLLLSCSSPPVEKPLVITETPEVSTRRSAEIEAEVQVKLADGLTAKLWATDSLAPDPIALSIADNGDVFLTSTERQKNSEFDIRGHQDWMIPSISFQSVEDRRAFLRKIFAPENSAKNDWLADLNNDGSHDWRDLAVEKDEVWKLQDTDGDGRADRSTRVVRDFNEEITDVAEGLLVRDNDMFIGIGPDLWRLQDKDGDGLPEEKESISHGWAVHIGFSGHGMSGIVQGPDGKIWWGIGDIGANLTDKDGNKHVYPHEGIIVRCNPDGSDFEVFATGLRNTHEFVFDAYGNLITSDNDGDHAGESERLMHIIEGADIGWRANWQYGKYTDPRNNGYNVWMDERFYVPRWEGQAAHILPPITNYHNGPTGMVFNPGTALGKAWRNRFFLVEFTGTPTRSHIWSFTLKPKGATFALNEEKDMVGGILPTGIRFGPDGALYAADWITGWGTKDYGRVWKFDVAEDRNDLAAERKATQEYLQLDYGKAGADQLSTLLGWSDQRVRLKAQFELTRRGMDGLKAFKAAAKNGTDILARIHGIWGLGQIASKERDAVATLRDLLSDADPEIIAQSAKVLGDARDPESAEKLISLLGHEAPRVKLYAAQALGRIGSKEAIPALIAMIDRNNDADHYLRLAGVVALSRIGAEKEMAALAGNKERDLRIAAVMVLRRLKSEQLSLFLKDADPYIITEAARAIHDDRSVPSQLPQVAALLSRTDLKQDPLLRRAISAAQRVGTARELDLLVKFADRKDIPSPIRAEAIAALGTWAEPSLVDRVDGVYRGPVKRDPAQVKSKVTAPAGSWLQEKDPAVLLAVGAMLRELSIPSYNQDMDNLVRNAASPAVRAGMLTELSRMGYAELESLVEAAMKDSDENVRTTGIGLLTDVKPDNDRLMTIARPILRKGTLREQQQLLRVLDKIPASLTEGILGEVADGIKSKQIPVGILLELNQAMDSTHSSALREKVASLKGNDDETLYGGNADGGAGYFFWNPTGQCVRCHAIGGEGGKVGPDLTYIGDVLSREQIREALMDPGARIAPGYGTITLTLNDGSKATGTVMEEDSRMIVLKTQDAEPLRIERSRVTARENGASGMPAMGLAMSKEELRNLIEFLSSRKKGK